MKRGRSGSIDLFSDHSNSVGGASPSSSSPARHGSSGGLGRSSSARSDGGSAGAVAGGGGGGGGGGGMGGGMDDEATRQKVLHAERMRIAMANMSEGQKERFEFFRRSHFQRDTIKRIMLESFSRVREGSSSTAAAAAAAAAVAAGGEGGLGVDMNEQMVIVLSALCKLFVGDLVHGARQVMEERGEEGAIPPARLREALRRAVREKRLPVMRGGLQPPPPPPPPST